VNRSYLLQALYLAWILVFLQGAIPSHAQEYLANVREFTMADGLSNDQVLSLLQDSEGFIWIGTKYGLNRFDGHQFRVFTKESHDLQSNIINHLIEGPGWPYLWIIRSQENFGNYAYYSIDLLDPAKEIASPWEDVFPSLPFSAESGRSAYLRPQKGSYFWLKNRDTTCWTTAVHSARSACRQIFNSLVLRRVGSFSGNWTIVMSPLISTAKRSDLFV
jgi:hypothetical protein